MLLNWDTGTWNERHLKAISESLKGTVGLAFNSVGWLKPHSVLRVQDNKCKSCHHALGVSYFSAWNHEFSSVSPLTTHHY